MAITVARVSKRGGEKLFLVPDTPDLYSFNPNSLSPHLLRGFSPDYKLEDDEWFWITYSNLEKDGFTDKIISSLISSSLETLHSDLIPRVKYICNICGEVFNFQDVPTKALLPRKALLRLGDRLEFRAETTFISVHDLPDVSYCKKSDRLYFQRFDKARKIFPALLDVYREATHQEINIILSQPFIKIDESKLDISALTLTMSRRIAHLYDLTKGDPASLAARVTAFKNTLADRQIDGLPYDHTLNSFIVDSAEALRILIHGLSQDVWKDTVANQIRASNSSRILSTTPTTSPKIALANTGEPVDLIELSEEASVL